MCSLSQKGMFLFLPFNAVSVIYEMTNKCPQQYDVLQKLDCF